MLSLSYNFSERCYLEAAQKTLGAADNKELCQKIDVRYSYGQVSAEEYKNHYNPDFWQVRKVSWILSVPFRLIVASGALIESAIDSLLKDQTSSKVNLFCASRLIEYAVGDLICIFNDRIGQHWTTDAYVHLRLYFLAKQGIDQRQNAFDSWFRDPLEVQLGRLKRINESTPSWLKQVMSLSKK